MRADQAASLLENRRTRTHPGKARDVQAPLPLNLGGAECMRTQRHFAPRAWAYFVAEKSDAERNEDQVILFELAVSCTEASHACDIPSSRV